ncbi:MULTISPECIES: hypothetical protein [unclassified Nocardia]|uniref:hypothetical protein n=1 Tax=unclassified Nocardia TaxID=2637762 RepID=UPI001CE4A078|nr:MULTISPECIES: hypothetical protein [unclassified Nocardia]
MIARTIAIATTATMLGIEVAWLLFAHGSIGWITALVVASVGVMVATGARYRPSMITARILVGLLLLGSVADRFGLLGGPGSSGVSWGEYSAFTDYTRKLLPLRLAPLAPTAAATATAAEFTLGLALLIGYAVRYAAAAAAALLTTFGLAMATSVGISDMLSYAVPVLAAGAALIATTAIAPDRRRSTLQPS